VEPRFVWEVAYPCGTSLRVVKCMRGGSMFRYRDERYRNVRCQDVRYRDKSSFKKCAIRTMLLLLSALSGCVLSGIMLNSVCVIGMWAIAPCANGTHSEKHMHSSPTRSNAHTLTFHTGRSVLDGLFTYVRTINYAAQIQHGIRTKYTIYTIYNNIYK